MAQVTSSRFNNFLSVENANVAVANTLTEIATIEVAGLSRLFLQLTVANHDLSQFVISARATNNAPWSVLYSTSDDYDTPRGIMIGVSGDLSSLAVGDTGDITLDVPGFYEMKFEASSSNAVGSIVSVFGGVA